ncbi:MAG: hypothetical protein KTR25_14680 [Myxococcales bacterium]|nr:hypothetical protein [Myxococcales bacterium]
METDLPSLVLSILSTVIAVASAYLAQFKKGDLSLPPLRTYRVEPLNYRVEKASYRALRLYLIVTLLNTGAITKAVSHMRVRLRSPDGSEGLLFWENEYEELWGDEGTYAKQPTLEPYGSRSAIYSFKSVLDVPTGLFVSALEESGKTSPEKAYSAEIQVLRGKSWKTYRKFLLHYDGSNRQEYDFMRINGR